MHLRQFYKKIRDVEVTIDEPFPLMCSFPTADGGRGGVISEVNRYEAARLIVEGRATLATSEQRDGYLAEQAETKRVTDEFEAARRRHLQFFSNLDVRPVAPVRQLGKK